MKTRTILFLIVSTIAFQQCHTFHGTVAHPDTPSPSFKPLDRSFQPYPIPPPPSSEDTIFLTNPSFQEDIPRCCIAPRGWMDMGGINESPPDIQPGSFDVNLSAFDGDTYVSLVSRDNDTHESLGQELPIALKKGERYRFRIFLAQSPSLLSMSRLTNDPVQFTEPMQFVVIGMNGIKTKQEILSRSEPITGSEWRPFEAVLAPTFDIDYLVLGVASPQGPTNGHILIDHCSPIVRIIE